MSDKLTTFMPTPVAVETFSPAGSMNKPACLAISLWIIVCEAPVSRQHLTITQSSSFLAGVSHKMYGYVYDMPSLTYVFSRTGVREYVCTIAMYWLKCKEVITALTPILCASLNMALSLSLFRERNLRIYAPIK